MEELEARMRMPEFERGQFRITRIWNTVNMNFKLSVPLNTHIRGTNEYGQTYQNGILPSPYGLGFVNGVQPDWICPSDFFNNDVLVGIEGFGNIIPGENPPDIKFLIYGSAMPDDGSVCVDGGFSGEEG